MPPDTTSQRSAPADTASFAAMGWLIDETLSTWLKKHKIAKKDVVLVRAGTGCKVYELKDSSGVLKPVDPESKSKSAFKALAKSGQLFSVEISETEMQMVSTADVAWLPKAMSEAEVENFLEMRKSVLGRVEGRGDPITPLTANSVWADAGGCCMFEGCAKDLTYVPLYNKGQRIAYLAHIIASDPDGPRGTALDSHRLANNAENIMLMCDAHHRLIDVFERDTYSAKMLDEMRLVHKNKVQLYREALRFPQAEVMTIFGAVGQVTTSYPLSHFLDALLSEKLSMHPSVKSHLDYQSRDARTSPDFWGHYLHAMELNIQNMVKDLARPKKEVLAVFPLHHTPTLVLAGRITGEARQVCVFQKSQKRDSWKWDDDAVPLPPGTFKVFGELEKWSEEALLTVELTAKIDGNALPGDLALKVGSGDIPWIRVTLDATSSECLQRKEDLEQAIGVIRKTINLMQDDMRATRIHLIIISPSSVVFRIGQLMRPGHHSEFVLYDRPNRSETFREAFSITGYSVTPPNGSEYPSISIR